MDALASVLVACRDNLQDVCIQGKLELTQIVADALGDLPHLQHLDLDGVRGEYTSFYVSNPKLTMALCKRMRRGLRAILARTALKTIRLRLSTQVPISELDIWRGICSSLFKDGSFACKDHRYTDFSILL